MHLIVSDPSGYLQKIDIMMFNEYFGVRSYLFSHSASVTALSWSGSYWIRTQHHARTFTPWGQIRVARSYTGMKQAENLRTESRTESIQQSKSIKQRDRQLLTITFTPIGKLE